MKNQYFGDIRDLFKYDLIQKIMEQCPTLRQFAFIPMLTANDDRTDGNRRVIDDKRMQGRPGSENNELKTFLRKFDEVSSKERDFRVIQNYFTGTRIQTEIYDPTPRYFENRERKKYFSNIPGTILESALVFVDPDNGLQVKTPSRKHILYSEVISLFNCIHDDSLLMIY